MHSHPLHTFPGTRIGMRPAGPRSPLHVIYVAFSLYRIPLQDSSWLYPGIVNLPQHNLQFSSGCPTPMSPPLISVTLLAFAVAAVPSLSDTIPSYILLHQIHISLMLPALTALRSEIDRRNHSQCLGQHSRLLPRYAANQSSSQVFRTSFLCHWLL